MQRKPPPRNKFIKIVTDTKEENHKLQSGIVLLVRGRVFISKVLPNDNDSGYHSYISFEEVKQ